MPRFSIILPCFNAAATLPDTLESIRAQSCRDWEVICVDDGSTDDTVSIIDAHAAQDDRICLIRNPRKGPSAARNTGGLSYATGEILAFCDADDLWEPRKLERLSAIFETADPDAVYGQVAFFDGDAGARMRRSTVPDGPVTIAMLLGENPVCTTSNLSVTRQAFAATGGFDEGLVHNEDLEWLVRCVGTGRRIIGDPALHVLYRRTPGGLSSDLMRMRDSRTRVLDSAATFGVRPDARAEAIFARYLARRALRLDAEARLALGFALRGLRTNPVAFLFPLRRGAATALAALLAPVFPRPLRRALFSSK
ncbi:glucosyltransferase [Roseibacterium elongatum DSM 19469]|uniref:Glucosyltransferase n=1 Tax=Roseicyclus elongatus DSM 19469 TaxID=1294273 RepID=W8S908_9RHOB|nr:glycosyltransferase family 2 protein [Roseibacterium elongatum]AHM05431.1 glucosyltransferase [Roseibacterium elongatum DSM 19469]